MLRLLGFMWRGVEDRFLIVEWFGVGGEKY
jgi:hypothetical protein